MDQTDIMIIHQETQNNLGVKPKGEGKLEGGLHDVKQGA